MKKHIAMAVLFLIFVSGVLLLIMQNSKHTNDISCPEAADEFSKETMKRQIREVIQEMLADGSLSGLAAPPAAHEQEPENADDLSDMMAAFRGG